VLLALEDDSGKNRNQDSEPKFGARPLLPIPSLQIPNLPELTAETEGNEPRQTASPCSCSFLRVTGLEHDAEPTSSFTFGSARFWQYRIQRHTRAVDAPRSACM
jgi:hypothetical protein